MQVLLGLRLLDLRGIYICIYGSTALLLYDDDDDDDDDDDVSMLWSLAVTNFTMFTFSYAFVST